MSAPAWADGADINDEGAPDEWRVHWSTSVPVPGVRTYDSNEEQAARVFAEQTEGAGPSLHAGPFVVLAVATGSDDQVLFAPVVARRLAIELLQHAEAIEAVSDR